MHAPVSWQWMILGDLGNVLMNAFFSSHGTLEDPTRSNQLGSQHHASAETKKACASAR